MSPSSTVSTVDVSSIDDAVDCSVSYDVLWVDCVAATSDLLNLVKKLWPADSSPLCLGAIVNVLLILLLQVTPFLVALSWCDARL